MSVTTTVRPSASSRFSLRQREDAQFHLQPTYLTLHRMLIRYQNIILVQPPREELRSPLGYQRTKWLHNIEYARTLLLQLERAAQAIKIQSTKRDVIKDLAEKRNIIKRLRSRVEEIGREAESFGEEEWETDRRAETLEEILGRPPLDADHDTGGSLVNEKPVSSINPAEDVDAAPIPDQDALFGARRRRGKDKGTGPIPDTATTSGFSNLETTERILLDDSRTQRELEESLVSMAAQLKQQSIAMNTALRHDQTLIDRAQGGLETSVSSMASAFQNMQWLRRMSEEQGFFGRLKLYGMIVGMWMLLILLVFVMPKLRF